MRHMVVILLAAVLFTHSLTVASAQDASRLQRSHDFYLQWDNDAWTKPLLWPQDKFDGSDDGYTNGVRLEYLADGKDAPIWLRWVGLGLEDQTYSYRR
jgi:hypothetical protein